MRLSWKERRAIQKDMQMARQNYRMVYLLYPTETECTACGGVDDFTDSAYDVSCTTCNGVGYTLSWAVWPLHARVKYMDVLNLYAPAIPPGLELGDAELYVSVEAKAAITEVMEESRAYVYIDGQRFRPSAMSPDGVGRTDEWRVELKKHAPEARLAGY